MKHRDQSIVLATVGAPHGVRGEVRVKSFTEDPTALDQYGALATDKGERIEVERLRPSGDLLIVKFRGVDDRNAAEALKGRRLSVPRSALPAIQDDEFYHADLIGLSAVSGEGMALGKVAAVLNHGAGDILEIAPGNGASALLVPFTRANVPDIDLAGGRLVVAPPAEIEVREDSAADPETHAGREEQMIIVAGTIRIPTDKIEALLPTARATLAATRKEEGCLLYSYAFDVEEGGLLRIFERWESRAHLEAHAKQPHMGPWRAKLAEIGASGRDIKVYEADDGTQL